MWREEIWLGLSGPATRFSPTYLHIYWHLNILVETTGASQSCSVCVFSGPLCFSLQAAVDCVVSSFYHRYVGSLVYPNSSIVGIYFLTPVFFFFRLCQWSSWKPSPAIRGSLYLQLSIWIVVVNLEKGNSGSLCTQLMAAQGEAHVT